jgi:seryl-tRNA(Sec) selenium transferase
MVDAAYMNFPPEVMGSYTADGADLVCFSAKYFWGPNGGGFVCGRRDLIDAVAGLDFTTYESGRYRIFGRAFKLDRWTVAAVVLALREWIEMDHDARFATYHRQVDRFMERMGTATGLQMTPMNFTMDERFIPEPVNCVRIQTEERSGHVAGSLAAELRAGSPSIRVIVEADALGIVMETVREGDEAVIADRLRAVMQR